MGSPNRIKIGFHRIGIALMLLPMFSGMGTLGYGTYVWAKPLVKPARFEISHDKLGKAIVTYNHDPKLIGSELRAIFGAENVSDELLSVVDKAFREVERERSQALELIAIGAGLLVLAATLYGASWLVGWIVRGFTM